MWERIGEWMAFALPSRSQCMRLGGWLLFFLLMYGLFGSLFYARQQVLVQVHHWLTTNPWFKGELVTPETGLLPPVMKAVLFSLQPAQGKEAIQFRHFQVRLLPDGLFPPRIRLVMQGEYEKGTLLLQISRALFAPEQLTASLTLDKFPLASLIVRLAGTSAPSEKTTGRPLLEMTSGSLDGTASVILPLEKGVPVPAEGSGKGHILLGNGSALLRFPMLAEPRLEQLRGEVELQWNKKSVALRQLTLKNQILSCRFQGQATLNFQHVLDSRFDIQGRILISPDRLHQELVPPRTLAALKEHGEVRLSIRETLRHPALAVQ